MSYKLCLVYFHRAQVYLGSDLCVRVSETDACCRDLTDVTLADEDEDNNSIPTDNANRAIQGNVAMKVTEAGTKFVTGGQIPNQFKWCPIMVKFYPSK